MNERDSQNFHDGGPNGGDLSPRAFAASIGLSESSIRRWVDAGVIRASRTVGGHRRIPVTEALRLIRERRLRVVRPELLDLDAAEPQSTPRSADLVTDRLHELFLEGRVRRACRLVATLYVRGWSAAEICDGPLREVMHRIGDLWPGDELGVFIEHRATDMCIQAIDHLRGLVDSGEGRPVALGGAVAGDPFQIPSLMAALVLAAEGFHAVNTGADTPIAALRAAVHRHAPQLVWLSLSMPEIRRPTAAGIGRLADELEQAGISLIAGGRGVASCRQWLPRSVETAASMRELAAYARGMLARRES